MLYNVFFTKYSLRIQICVNLKWTCPKNLLCLQSCPWKHNSKWTERFGSFLFLVHYVGLARCCWTFISTVSCPASWSAEIYYSCCLRAGRSSSTIHSSPTAYVSISLPFSYLFFLVMGYFLFGPTKGPHPSYQCVCLCVLVCLLSTIYFISVKHVYYSVHNHFH